MDGETLEKGRGRADFFLAFFDVRTNHIHEYWDEGEVRDLIEDVVSGRKEGRVRVVLGVEVDVVHKVVHPSPHGVI